MQGGNRFLNFAEQVIARHRGLGFGFEPATMLFLEDQPQQAADQTAMQQFTTNLYHIRNITEENYLFRQNLTFLTQVLENKIYHNLYPSVEKQIEKTIREELPQAQETLVEKVSHQMYRLVQQGGVEQFEHLKTQILSEYEKTENITLREQQTLLRKLENIWNSSVYEQRLHTDRTLAERHETLFHHEKMVPGQNGRILPEREGFSGEQKKSAAHSQLTLQYEDSTGEEQTPAGHEIIQREREKLLREQELVVKKLEETVTEKETSQKVREKLLREREKLEKLIRERETIETEHEKLLKDRETVRTEHEKLLKDRETVRTEYEKLLKDRETVQTEHEKLLKDRETVQTEHEKLLNTQEIIQNGSKVFTEFPKSRESFGEVPLIRRSDAARQGSEMVYLEADETEVAESPALQTETVLERTLRLIEAQRQLLSKTVETEKLLRKEFSQTQSVPGEVFSRTILTKELLKKEVSTKELGNMQLEYSVEEVPQSIPELRETPPPVMQMLTVPEHVEAIENTIENTRTISERILSRAETAGSFWNTQAKMIERNARFGARQAAQEHGPTMEQAPIIYRPEETLAPEQQQKNRQLERKVNEIVKTVKQVEEKTIISKERIIEQQKEVAREVLRSNAALLVEGENAGYIQSRVQQSVETQIDQSVDQIANRVYRRLEDRLRSERGRRGLI